MTRNNGAIPADHAPREQLPEQRLSALFHACGRIRSRRTAMPRKIREIHTKTLLREPPREVGHDLPVRGNPMEKNHRSARGSLLLLHNRGLKLAATCINEVVPFSKRRREGEPQSCAAQQDSNDGPDGVTQLHRPLRARGRRASSA